jgi:hypothetical protein
MTRLPALLLPFALLCGMAAAARADDVPANQVSGVIHAINGTALLLQTRTGVLAPVDASAAIAAHMTSLLRVGGAVTALGARDPAGVLHATAVSRAKDSPLAWPSDD